MKRDRLATFCVLSVGYTLAAILWLKELAMNRNAVWLYIACAIVLMLLIFSFGM